MAERLVYQVEDRSILLPFYRRFLVDPILPHLPRTLNPNTITHAGHLANLAGTVMLVGLGAKSGWPFVAAMVLLQLYMWCDNADGAHARRTGQCSALGEFLDHGLDMLNTTYIALLTAMGLGAPPLWWVLIMLVIPGAAVATYWEQARTGMFRLGLLNQVESVTVLSLVLVISAAAGSDFWERTAIFGVTLRQGMLLWSFTTILFGMVRGMIRVATVAGLAAALPLLGLVAFGSALAGAAATSVISTAEAVALAGSANVCFGMRMLAVRLRGEHPRVEYSMPAFAALLAVMILWRAAGHELGEHVGSAVAMLAFAVFGGQAAMDARAGVQRLERMTA